MPSSLFPQQPQSNNNVLNLVDSVCIMAGGDPQALFERMVRTNPQFATFVEQNRGKAPDQIARENGIDPALLAHLPH